MWRRKSVPAWLVEELVTEVNGRAPARAALSATAWTAPAQASGEGNSTWTSAALGGARNKKTVSIQTIVHPFPHASRAGPSMPTVAGQAAKRASRRGGAGEKGPRRGGWRGQFREVVT